jgi:probable rRNA maturation factor
MLRFQVSNLKNILENFEVNTSYFLTICKKISTHEKISSDKFFEVIFCDDKLMKQLNQEHRGINKTTDVLSFALAENKDNLTNLLGEIYISIPFSKKEAKRLKTTLKTEINLLFTHGILHLLGFNHETKAHQKEMFDLQDWFLKE